MPWKTSKQEINEAIDGVSEAASKAVKESLARRVEYPKEVNALFERIGSLRAVVDRLPVEAA